MAVQIPMWLRGSHFTTITVRPQAVSASGVLSDTGTLMTFTRNKVNLSFNIEPMTEEINDDASVWQHNVVLADGYQVSLEVLNVNDGTDPDKVYALVNSSDYFKLVFVAGTGASQRTYTIYGSRGASGIGSQGRGASRSTLTLNSIDTGTGADAPVVRA